MMIDRNDVLTLRGPLTVRVHHHGSLYGGVAALVDGDGTRDCPLHFVLLACHADIADDAPIARTETLTAALAEEVLAQLRNQQVDVKDVLQTSNVAAAATDRYYSIVAGRVTQRNVNVGALGRVDAMIVTENAWTSIITPNIARIGGHAFLDGAFGIGFKQEAVRVKQFDLQEDATLLLIIGEEPALADAIAAGQDAKAIIEYVAGAAQISSPIVAVVR